MFLYSRIHFTEFDDVFTLYNAEDAFWRAYRDIQRLVWRPKKNHNNITIKMCRYATGILVNTYFSMVDLFHLDCKDSYCYCRDDDYMK